MKCVYVIFAEGFEEIEGLTVVDLLRRAGAEVQMAGLESGDVTGSHGIRVGMDLSLRDVDLNQAAAVVLPGGMPGTKHLGENARLSELLKEADSRQILIGAICAAPSVLGDLGLLRGRRAVCYPGLEDRLAGAEVCMEPVVTDSHIITSRGMGTAIAFGLELVCRLAGREQAEQIAASIVYSSNVK